MAQDPILHLIDLLFNVLQAVIIPQFSLISHDLDTFEEFCSVIFVECLSGLPDVFS